jgi:hypothetical protein
MIYFAEFMRIADVTTVAFGTDFHALIESLYPFNAT